MLSAIGTKNGPLERRMKLYIHLGMQKCGSKAIQQFSVANSAPLADMGYLYPEELSTGAWHRQLFREFGAKHDDLLSKLSKQDKKVILSFEGAYQAPADIIQKITRYAFEVNLLLLVRRPEDWCNSFINQLAKSHRSRFRQFNEFDVRSKPMRERYELSQHLERWKANSDVRKIDVLAYSKARSSVDQYLDWLGIGEEKKGDLTFSTVSQNRSLDKRSLRIILEIKRRVEKEDILTQVAAIKRAHKRLQKRWIDTREKKGIRLLSTQDEAWVSKNYLPKVEEVFQKYGSAHEMNFLTKELEGKQVLNLKINDEDQKLVDKIVKSASRKSSRELL